MENMETYDTLSGALSRIDQLREAKQIGYLKHRIVSAVMDRYNRIESAVIEWQVIRGKVNPVSANVPVQANANSGNGGNA